MVGPYSYDKVHANLCGKMNVLHSIYSFIYGKHSTIKREDGQSEMPLGFCQQTQICLRVSDMIGEGLSIRF